MAAVNTQDMLVSLYLLSTWTEVLHGEEELNWYDALQGN